MRNPEIIRTGNPNGEGMTIKYPTSVGTEIFALGIPNTWSGKGWALGPTWCYLIISDKVILVDTGRYGTLGALKDLLSVIGKRITDIDAVIPTYCHEDHDGNIAQIQRETNVDVWAHRLYPEMIAYHP